MSVLQKLTEGVQSRNLRAEGDALLNKWEATGLLEGLADGQSKQGMAVLLENQAKELLREATSMAAGDVEGFAAVAFPIVRRVFGGLIANELISVQPMSLPSGLIFFLDFTHDSQLQGSSYQNSSIYGGNVTGSQLTGGVDLDGAAGNTEGPRGHYDLGAGQTAATGSFTLTDNNAMAVGATGPIALDRSLTLAHKKLLRFDPDILAAADVATATHELTAIDVKKANIGGANLDLGNLQSCNIELKTGHTDFDVDSQGTARVIRRLTAVSPDDADAIRFFIIGTNASMDSPADGSEVIGGASSTVAHSPTQDGLYDGRGLGAVVGGTPWGLEGAGDGVPERASNGTTARIPEIDIRVESIAVTAQTKKLKAKWTPELGQDLNAYHNLDAEVELTGILSEQIALEIDRELLGELVNGAKAGTRYWSRAPGLFVNAGGSELGATSAAPDFTGTVSEWYETLIETINDVSAQIHRKTLRGGANFVVCSPEVANILEFTSGFRASVTADTDRGTIGAVKAGSLSKKFDVYVDPYFLRNVVLVGRKGSSFLESGFVYAPYVPLQVTPTIFGTEDFVPRKGVMTRYAKKMVRPDMYGLVVVRGLLGEEMPS